MTAALCFCPPSCHVSSFMAPKYIPKEDWAVVEKVRGHK